MGKLKSCHLTVRVPEDLKNLIDTRALQDYKENSELIREALNFYLRKDITRESIIQATLQDLRSQIAMLDKKIEVMNRLFVFWLPYFFATSPELPSGEEGTYLIKKANKRAEVMISGFKKDLQKDPIFFETLLADFFEMKEEKE